MVGWLIGNCILVCISMYWKAHHYKKKCQTRTVVVRERERQRVRVERKIRKCNKTNTIIKQFTKRTKNEISEMHGHLNMFVDMNYTSELCCIISTILIYWYECNKSTHRSGFILYIFFSVLCYAQWWRPF